MQAEPQAVMDEVHNFAGVEGFTYDLEGEDAVHDKINEQFPSFERISGWSINGQYDSMPKELESKLKVFFEPFNKLLSNLVKSDEYKGDKQLWFDVDGTEHKAGPGKRFLHEKEGEEEEEEKEEYGSELGFGSYEEGEYMDYLDWYDEMVLEEGEEGGEGEVGKEVFN